MAQAKTEPTTTRLSQLFTDPVIRRAFERAERDGGDTFALPTPRRPVLAGGEAACLELA